MLAGLLVLPGASSGIFASGSQWSLSGSKPGEGDLVRTAFNYRMRGMVRLLFFWVGKDNVGGGTITFLDAASGSRQSWVEGVEVLFGSEPDQVPGRHNRWGYCRELAYWDMTDEALGPTLAQTVFEGFMSFSDEKSIDEVRRGSNEGGGEPLALYEGTISRVAPTGASVQLRRFRSHGAATYHEVGAVGDDYVDRALPRPPDIERNLDNDGSYGRPFGFLSAIRSLAQEVLDNPVERGSPAKNKGAMVPYVYNARRYTLRLKDVKVHERFKLSTGDQHLRVLQFDMETENHQDGNRHAFTIYLGTQGKYRGIPLRIEDKPRWWLKVQLELQAG
jgi:hypothetical protein